MYQYIYRPILVLGERKIIAPPRNSLALRSMAENWTFSSVKTCSARLASRKNSKTVWPMYLRLSRENVLETVLVRISPVLSTVKLPVGSGGGALLCPLKMFKR